MTTPVFRVETHSRGSYRLYQPALHAVWFWSIGRVVVWQEREQYLTLQLEDVGVEIPDEGVDLMIIDCLDLVWSLVQDNPELAEQLMRALESGEPVVAHTMAETQPPDLVQLTIMILEEAMSRAVMRTRGL